jgi:hypothetical protein
MTSPETKRKLPVTKILVAFSVLLLAFVCGGGILVFDYQSGSLSSTFLPGDDTNPALQLSARNRGFSKGVNHSGTRVGTNATTGETILAVGELEFTVTRAAIKHKGKVLAELPPNASSVEVDAYRGSVRILVDGQLVATQSMQPE